MQVMYFSGRTYLCIRSLGRVNQSITSSHQYGQNKHHSIHMVWLHARHRMPSVIMSGLFVYRTVRCSHHANYHLCYYNNSALSVAGSVPEQNTEWHIFPPIRILFMVLPAASKTILGQATFIKSF